MQQFLEECSQLCPQDFFSKLPILQILMLEFLEFIRKH